MAESSAQRNAGVVREFIAGVMRGEFRGDLAAADVVWHMAGHNQVSGEYRGHEGVRDLFARMGELIGSPVAGKAGVEHAVEFHDLLASDDHVVALWRRTGRREGVTLDSPGVGIYHVRDGKIAEVWVLHWDQPAADAFFGSR